MSRNHGFGFIHVDTNVVSLVSGSVVALILMNLEREFEINPTKAAAIATFFKEADARFPTDKTVLAPFVGNGDYQRKFGNLNFAALEQIFRQHGYNTYFLAVPTKTIEFTNPHVMVVDVNDK